MAAFEAKLNEERTKRLKKRKEERKQRRKAEAAAVKKAEEDRRSMAINWPLNLIAYVSL